MHLDVVVSNAILVLKHLIQNQPKAAASLAEPPLQSLPIISHLARRVEDVRHAQAKACVLWLVGQYSPLPEGGVGVVEWAPDVLRKSAKHFTQEVLIFVSRSS
jgi:AP-3 complex subunit beta